MSMDTAKAVKKHMASPTGAAATAVMRELLARVHEARKQGMTADEAIAKEQALADELVRLTRLQ